jgi:hypothetical protein
MKGAPLEGGGPIRGGGGPARIGGGGAPLGGGGTQIDDKNKTRGELIVTSPKSDSLHVYKLLSDFKSWCKFFATVC